MEIEDKKNINMLIHKHFSEPLYKLYNEKHKGPPSGCPDGKYLKNLKVGTREIEVNDAILWNNKDTWHRSPFGKVQIGDNPNYKREFINIRIIKLSEDRKSSIESTHLDLSQFQKK